jgi:hypothetical protein
VAGGGGEGEGDRPHVYATTSFHADVSFDRTHGPSPAEHMMALKDTPGNVHLITCSYSS